MEKLVIIKTLSQLKELTAYIHANDYIAFDTETTGIDKEAKIIGFSISADPEKGFYVILKQWDKEKQQLIDLETLDDAKAIMELLSTKQLVMHNAVFDCYMVNNNFKVDLMPALHTDTMILSQLLNENRHNGLKELGTSIFGDDATNEQVLMKQSIKDNGGSLIKDCYELYKADADLIARYGAKDAVLTIKLFYIFAEQLMDEGLTDFFYEDESMPLLRGPTYDLNTTGLKVDSDKLQQLKGTLEVACLESKAFIHDELAKYLGDKIPVGNKKTKTLNIGSGKQLAWFLFFRLGEEFVTLTKEGKNLCKALGLKPPYSSKAKREFLQVVKDHKDRVYEEAKFNPKTKKLGRPKKVSDAWNYLAADKASLKKYATKYKWVARFLQYNKDLKLLTTYVEGIQNRIQYGIIRPSFLQHGTTSGRYSSRNPNFQNLPRDDKRIKSCIVSRPGKVFVGADYSQLEPRVFASLSGDERLQKCFESDDDFYSTIGIEIFDKYDATPKKEGSPNAFGIKYKHLRDIAKVVALSATYGTTAFKMAPAIGKSIAEAEEVIDDYFEKFPKVKQLMLDSHMAVIKNGKVESLFGRPRRMPKATMIPKIYGTAEHGDLPYEARNMLNLATNHRIQSTGASIMNRAAIDAWRACKTLAKEDPRWYEVKIVLQVHDELVLEGPEELSEDMVLVLKNSMETTVKLPGVVLEAIPKVGKNLAELK